MSTRITERLPADLPDADLRSSDLRPSDLERDAVRRGLLAQRHELEAQMRRASRELHRLRTTSDVSDPEVQPALMDALRSLDSAERESREVSFTLAHLDTQR